MPQLQRLVVITLAAMVVVIVVVIARMNIREPFRAEVQQTAVEDIATVDQITGYVRQRMSDRLLISKSPGGEQAYTVYFTPDTHVAEITPFGTRPSSPEAIGVGDRVAVYPTNDQLTGQNITAQAIDILAY